MPVSSRPPKLMAQVRQAVRLRQYSRRTEEAYAGWIKRFVRYHGLRHPSDLGAAEVERFRGHPKAGGPAALRQWAPAA